MNRGKNQSSKRAAASGSETGSKSSEMESEAKTAKEQPAAEGALIEVESKENIEVAPSTGTVPKKPKTKAKKADDVKPSTSSEKPDASKDPNRSILQLKVTIVGITPPIWRRIQVLNNDTFKDLSLNINEAIGWFAGHSHQFMAQDLKKDSNIFIVDGTLDGLTYDLSQERVRVFQEQTTKLSKFFAAPGDVVMYEYDLGASWMHQILVEKILPPPPPKAEYPKCTGGKRACPPEDCGGVVGYQHLLEVYKNPQHEEYDDLIAGWLEDSNPGFDPEKFERKKIFRNVWMWVGPNDPRF